MRIVFKKNGRPTKAEKGLLKNINTFLSSLDKEELEEYDFLKETITDGKRLEQIWGQIGEKATAAKEVKVEKQEPAKQEEVVEQKAEVEESKHEQISENESVDTDTGEIFEKQTDIPKEDTNFVNEEKQMEEAKIIEEINNETQTTGQNQSNHDVPFDFNPLGDQITERSYTQNQNTYTEKIPEPDFTNNLNSEDEIKKSEKSAPDMSDDDSGKKDSQNKSENTESDSSINNVTNEAMNDASDKDKKLAAKQLVSTLLSTYESLHQVAQQLAIYPEEKLHEQYVNDELSPNIEIPVDVDTTVTITEYVKNYNSDVKELLTYDPEFGEKVRPALERIFAKKGWGLTDEQFVMIEFGKDVAAKGMGLIALKKQMKAQMQMFMDFHKKTTQSTPSATAVDPDSITQTPPQEEMPNVETPEAEIPTEDIPTDFNTTEETTEEETEVHPIH